MEKDDAERKLQDKGFWLAYRAVIVCAYKNFEREEYFSWVENNVKLSF